MFRIVFIIVLLTCVSASQKLNVRTKSGLVSGIKDSAYMFYGIPYAQPPIGSLRFRSPQSVSSWDGVLDAGKPGSICYQEQYKGAMSEDCLFLNIFVPPSVGVGEEYLTGSYPIMIYFSGDQRFTSGGSNFLKPIYLTKSETTQREQIIITFNYRVGAFWILL
ncbi:pnbA [Acrasis kona]|uniref:PnbA n=1 Tax=Acrasis kona TaxID=1008807 RepID=A0AAW2Z763_9EUKA